MSVYLFHTTTLVLLGGNTQAGQCAKAVWTKHDVTPHWFGRGCHPYLNTYTQKHPLPKPIATMSDALLVQILIDFAKEQPAENILALMPCSQDALAFITRQKQGLETYFVILWDVPATEDPLPLLINHQRNAHI